MKSKSKRINQLKITIIDNDPHMMDNHWYSGWDETKPKYKGRYKLNIWLLTPLRPVQLQSTLSWPPSDLARRARWKEHQEQYEIWRAQSQQIKDDINRQSPIPPLLGMPSEKQTLKTSKRGLIYKWYMPPVPSLIRAQLLTDHNRNKSWNIQWLFPDQTLEFVLDQNDCETETWRNKDGLPSLVYKKTYAHAFNLPEDYYMPHVAETFIDEDIDYEYEEFKKRVLHLISLGDVAEMEVKSVMNKFPAYTERWMTET